MLQRLMKRPVTPSIHLELGFSDKAKGLRLLTALAEDRSVSVYILRARITEDSAWVRLEIQGPNPRILEVAALLNDSATIKDPFWRPVSRAS